MIQDYEKYGVMDVEDKQALFKVVKDVDRYIVTDSSSVEDDVLDTALGCLDDALRSGDELVDNFAQTEPSFLVDINEDVGFNLVEDLIETGSESPNQGLSEEHVSGNVKPSMKSIPSLNHSLDETPRIRVIVRKRPLNDKEDERGDIDVIHCDASSSSLTVYEPKTKVDTTKYIETHDFVFDDVFDADVDNDALYLQTVRPLVTAVFNSGRGTCFAYGQTGSGKTYTMEPLPLRAAEDIFHIAGTVTEFQNVTLHVSCYEIYGGKVFDLLGGRARLEVREDAKRKVQVVGLKEVQVTSLADLSRLCQHAACARSTGSTGANDESSRSHSIMTFAVKTQRDGNNIHYSKMTEKARVSRQAGVASLKSDTTVGKLSFIDLAGSERGADTYDNDKQTRLEGAEINKSLLALKECIRALDMDAGHVPFRGSKLTSVLRDSFIGKNTRTVMIANISPSSSSCEHTLNTLRYADRVKEMKKDNNNNNKSGRGGASRRESMVGVGMVLPKPDGIAAKLLQADRIDSALQKPHHAKGKEPREGRDGKEDRDVVEMHRQYIEDAMGLLRQEMDLLAKTDPISPVSISIKEYTRELNSILDQRLKAISNLQAAIREI